jgi:hypothetical protein
MSASSERKPPSLRALLVVAAPFVVLFALAIRAMAFPIGSGSDPFAVITPGHEGDVMAFVGPDIDHGFAGVPVEGVRIERSVIELRLGPAPEVAGCADASPGSVVIGIAGSAEQPADASTAGDLFVGAHICGVPPQAIARSSSSLAQRLATRDHSRVWQPMSNGGILSPFLTRQPLSVFWALLGMLGLGTLASMFAARLSRAPDALTRDEQPSSRLRLYGTAVVAALVIVVGTFLRVRIAARLPMEIDENWSIPSVHAVLGQDHDAWIHPPIHRAIQQLWGHAIGWRLGDPPLLLRLPSVLASAAALMLSGWHAFRQRSPIAAALLTPVAIAPTIVQSTVLARPYGFSFLAMSLVLVTLFPALGGRPTPRAWAVALLATGVAIWTDLPTGAATSALFALALGGEALRAPKATTAFTCTAIVAVLVFAAPIASGAIVALRDQRNPAPRVQSEAAPNLRPERSEGSDFNPRVTSIASFAWGGNPASGTSQKNTLAMLFFAAAGAATITAVLRRDGSSALAPATLFALALVSAQLVAVRPRNILFLPLGMAVFLGNAGRTLERRRSREEITPPKSKNGAWELPPKNGDPGNRSLLEHEGLDDA